MSVQAGNLIGISLDDIFQCQFCVGWTGERASLFASLSDGLHELYIVRTLCPGSYRD